MSQSAGDGQAPKNTTSPCVPTSITWGDNIVDGLFAVARSLDGIAKAIQDLGTANASTPMGAIELLASEVKDGFQKLSVAVGSVNKVEDDY